MFRVTLCSSVHHCTWVLLVRTEDKAEALERAEDFLNDHLKNYRGADECTIKALPDNYKAELSTTQMECLIDHTLCILEHDN